MKSRAAPVAKRRGTKIWCPHCGTIQMSHAEKPEKFWLPRERRYRGKKYKDVQWFRRARVCDGCSRHFVTGEVSEDLIMELMGFRDRAAAMLRPKVDRAVRQQRWLSRDETIPENWLRSSCEAQHGGSPTRRVRPYVRPVMQGAFTDHQDMAGRSIFRANTFLVGKALERARGTIHRFFDRIETATYPSVLRWTAR